MSHKHAKQVRASILAAAIAAIASAPTLAVTTIWDGGAAVGNTNWSAAANWTGNVVPPAANDVEFASAFTSGTNILTAGNRTVNSLIINTLTPFSISGGPTDVLTITTGTLVREDLVEGEEGNTTINTAVALGASGIWSVWGSGTLAINGPINQVGANRSLTKYGWGLLLLTNGAGNYSGGTFIEEANLQMNGVWNGTGAISVASGAGLDVSAATIGNPLILRGDGVENWGALRALTTSTINGPVTLLANSRISVRSEVLTINGAISDGLSNFGLTKSGAGELRLNAVNTHKGGTTISEGTLSVPSDAALGTGDVSITGARLLYTANTSAARDFTMTNGRLQANAGVTVALSRSEIRGGFIAGPGTFSTTNSTALMGVTTFAGANLQATGVTSFTNFINGGNITSSAAVLWDGGINVSSGIITLNSGTLSTTAFSNDGVININNTATLANSGNNLVSGGGSRMAIAAGGSLDVSSNALELNGALLVNNGTILGPTNVNFGSVAKGSGVYGAVNVTDGGKFSPGNSPGSATTGSTTWNSGGNYVVEIADALAGAGIGWDTWNINGFLNVNATNTTNGRFTISLSSMDALTANFDPHLDYAWPILHTTDGINFDPSAITLDTSGFKNSLAGGHFSLQFTATDLIVQFSAVPEPATMLAFVAAALIANRRFSRRHTDRTRV